MRFLICPLCGKSTSLNNFDPSGFDRDIYAQSFVGLGKGKGFASTDKQSILHSSTTLMIKNRLLNLLLMLHQEGIMKESEIRELFKFETKKNDEELAYKAILEEKNTRIRNLTDELGASRAIIEEKDSIIVRLSSKVQEYSTYIRDRDLKIGNLREELERVSGDRSNKERITDILIYVENELGPDFRFYEDDPVDELRYVVEKLIDEYRASLARGEELNNE